MKLIANVEHARRAATVSTTGELSDHLCGPAAALLRLYARALAAEGYAPDEIACQVAGLLFKIAFFEEVPETVAEVTEGRWPWQYNHERRRDLMPAEDGRFSHALRLRQGLHAAPEKEERPAVKGRKQKARKP